MDLMTIKMEGVAKNNALLGPISNNTNFVIMVFYHEGYLTKKNYRGKDDLAFYLVPQKKKMIHCKKVGLYHHPVI